MVLALTVAAGAAACGGGDRSRIDLAAPDLTRIPAAPTTTSTLLPVLPVSAHATGSTVEAFAEPGGTTAVTTLSNPTHERVPLVMLVRARQGDWLEVQIPRRPNGSTVWVKAEQVELREMGSTVLIELGARRLSVLDPFGHPLLVEPVAVGKPVTPTPVGEFYIDAIVENPGRPYGAWQLSVAGFSDVLMRFGGGNGQIAIHGWHDPGVVGKDVSNGCIRMGNEAVSRVAELVGLGTPVSIVA